MQCVFAFDRDDTVTSGSAPGPIPTAWVKHLADETDHEVWATGNQKLTGEAGIPGTDDLIERYHERWGDPVEHFEARSHPKVETREGLPAGAPDPDIVSAVYLREGNPAPSGWQSGGSLSRTRSLRLLAALFPDHDEYVVIDNKYLGHLREWTHLYPEEFVSFVGTLDSLADVATPEDVGVPEEYDWPRTEE